MGNENDAFVSDENGSAVPSGYPSQSEPPNNPTRLGQVCDVDVDRPSGQNKLLRWVSEDALVDQIFSEAVEWEQSSSFFPKRDQWLNEAMRLAYPVFLLFFLQPEKAEAQLTWYPAAEELPKKLIRHKPALAALKLVTKPKNIDDEKKCSEWTYKLRWAENRAITPSEFLECIGTISLANAKAEVRKQRRSEREESGKPVRKRKPVINVSISGNEGSRSFKVNLDEQHYRALMLVDENREYENASHMLDIFKGMRSGPA